MPRSTTYTLVFVNDKNDPAYETYRLRVDGPGDRTIVTINGLHRNDTGAIVTSVPTSSLSPGRYAVRLDGVHGAQATLAGEYLLEIR